MRRICTMALLLALATGTVCEIAARAILHSETYISALGLNDDELLWRAMWDAQAYHQGKEGRQRLLRQDPLLGWTLAPNVDEVRGPSKVAVHSDAHGIRGTRQHPIAARPGTLRIAAIGDSFTFGDEVGDDDTFPAQLQRSLPSTEVLNFGVSGYGQDQMLLRMRRDALPFAPDIVLIGYVQIDNIRNLMNFRTFAKPRFQLVQGKLRLGNVPIPTEEELLRTDEWTPALLRLYRLWQRQPAQDSRARMAQSEELTAALLRQMVAEARAAHAFALIVCVPLGDRECAPPPRQVCADPGTACVTATAAMRAAASRGEVLTQNAHNSAAGNRAIAQAIRERLLQLNLVPAAAAGQGTSPIGAPANPPPSVP